jgi:acetyl-CoA C-acetyltransferase/acetyl-CoA acyltransferase
MPEPLYIIDGVRTPFCRAGTDLASMPAEELGRIAVNALLARTGVDPGKLDEVIFGCVCQPPDAANVARVIALRAGVPKEVPAVTVHRNCASGFESITTAYERAAAGHGSLFLVGGVDSMSSVPLLYRPAAAKKFAGVAKAKTVSARMAAYSKFRPEDFAPRIGLKLGLSDPVCGLNMGETAEILAREGGISRDAQDDFSLKSHQRATAAEVRLADEITPIYLPGAKALEHDNGPRGSQTLEALRKLKPVFDQYGSVTAGNSSQITDGAVALLVGTAERVRELGRPVLGKLIDFAYAGCDPARMGLGPVYAMDALERRSGLTAPSANLVEINEAFAAQVLACLRLMRENGRELDPAKLNVNGGAIALGHPVGATGSRLVLTALKELQRRGERTALVSACVGGGQGGALWLEREPSTSFSA